MPDMKAVGKAGKANSNFCTKVSCLFVSSGSASIFPMIVQGFILWLRVIAVAQCDVRIRHSLLNVLHWKKVPPPVGNYCLFFWVGKHVFESLLLSLLEEGWPSVAKHTPMHRNQITSRTYLLGAIGLVALGMFSLVGLYLCWRTERPWLSVPLTLLLFFSKSQATPEQHDMFAIKSELTSINLVSFHLSFFLFWPLFFRFANDRKLVSCFLRTASREQVLLIQSLPSKNAQTHYITPLSIL